MVLRDFARDLSVCTAEEIWQRWDERKRSSLEKIKPGIFERMVQNHNPLYFLLQNIFFSNHRGDNRWLYAPYHRDLICKPIVDYTIEPRSMSSSVGLVCLAPRDTFKSTIGQRALPLWLSLRFKHLYERDARIAIVHHKEQLASANLMRLKNVAVKHPWFRHNWGEFSSIKDWDTKTEFRWPCAADMFQAEKSLTAAGLGASLTGFHYDAIVFDDPVTEEHSSKKVREEALTKYNATLFTLDTLEGLLYHFGTRYHIHDLWAPMVDPTARQQIEQDIDYKAIVLAAKDEAGNLTHPHRLTEEFLEKRRRQIVRSTGSEIYWWLQYFNKVRTSEMIAADVKWLRECSVKDISHGAWYCIFVDPAWKGDANWGEGDYASIQVWAFERRGHLVLQYLVDGFHSNTLTEAEGKQLIYRFMRKYSLHDVAPEERGGYGFRQSLRNEAASQGLVINVIDLKSMQSNKNQRISGFIGKAQVGEVFICEECDPIVARALKDQFGDHPQNVHEDALDCAGYTCDPAITEAYVPLFNTRLYEARSSFQDGEFDDEPPRTLYCMS